MLHSPYAYRLELFMPDGTAIGRAELDVDWEPAREWTRFAAVRAGRIPAAALDTMTIVDPVWHPKGGEPYVDGFMVALTVDGAEVAHTFKTAYFAQLARSAIAGLTDRKGTKTPESIRYVTTAYRELETARVEPTAPFMAREVAPVLTMKAGSLDAMIARAAPGEAAGDDMPVFLPRRVLDEAARLTGTAGQKETGGILIGHLHQDPHRLELFAEVTAQIPARHTQADLTTLTFTAETWTDVRNAIALRGRDELMLGWWHSHPVREWCRRCPPERQRTCSLAAGFLSAHDQALHRTVFPRAYSLALVVNDVAVGGPSFSLFGWREGLLDRRDFGVLEEESDQARRS